jgi:hypothetical protein
MSTTDCQNPRHDHTDEDGAPLRCPDCDQATHYDMDAEDYRHDDPTAPPCFLRP